MLLNLDYNLYKAIPGCVLFRDNDQQLIAYLKNTR